MAIKIKLLQHGGPTRIMVQADDNRELTHWFERFSGFVVAVGKKPTSFSESWCVAEMRREWVCGGANG